MAVRRLIISFCDVGTKRKERYINKFMDQSDDENRRNELFQIEWEPTVTTTSTHLALRILQIGSRQNGHALRLRRMPRFAAGRSAHGVLYARITSFLRLPLSRVVVVVVVYWEETVSSNR